MRLDLAATLVAMLAAVATVVDAAPDRCSRIQQRREFRTLTHTDRMAFINAVRGLQSQTPRPNRYDNYVRQHELAHLLAHGNARFLSWHRGYVRAFEKDLQIINPAVTVPYWDWATDSQAPQAAMIFQAAYFGGNGNPNDRYCVWDGHFHRGVWQPLNSKRCIARRFDGGNVINRVWSWPALNSRVMTLTTYDSFRQAFELTHGNIHNGIGDLFTTMRSPDDPIFWLHHSFVDKVWNDWQLRNPSNFRSYGGRNHDGTTARPTDSLGFGYVVNDVFETRNLCYTYAPFGPAPPRSNNLARRDYSAVAANIMPTVVAANIMPTVVESLPAISTLLSYNVTAPVSGLPVYTNGTVPISDTNVSVNITGVLVKEGNYSAGLEEVYNEPGNILNLGVPPPLPEAWCRMNNLDVKFARKVEAAAAKVLYQLNNLPGYVSECALVNNANALAQLARQGVKFTGYVGNRKIEIPYDSAKPLEAVKKVQEKTVAIVQQVRKQVHFIYPKVIANIYSQINVFNGGRTAMPTIKGVIGGDKYADAEDCDEEDYDEEEDCEEEGELPAEEEDCEDEEAEEEDCEEDAGEKPTEEEDCEEEGELPTEEDCEEEGEKPTEEEDCEEEGEKPTEEEDCEDEDGKELSKEYKSQPKPAY